MSIAAALVIKPMDELFDVRAPLRVLALLLLVLAVSDREPQKPEGEHGELPQEKDEQVTLEESVSFPAKLVIVHFTNV